MRSRIKFALFALLISSISFAQGDDYFQQIVDYEIKLSLDDQLHLLTGDWAMMYHNQSPDTLEIIYIHLWPNAYSDPKTALAKQMMKQGDLSLFNAKPEEQGFIDQLSFSSPTNTIFFQRDSINPDIGILRLAKALAPGDSLKIESPFRVKIPNNFSRLGHVDQSYQITQWYPKPAVYDKDGWHPMPYLNQGEFYSEFGSFDIKITLPSNYIVAASGVQQISENWDFIEERWRQGKNAIPNNKFPPSNEETRTWHFIADDVHDFGWFADKRWMVNIDTAVLEDGTQIPVYAYYTNYNKKVWEKSAFYLKRSVEFYSKNVGPYPYPQASAVDGTISAGGGMEYPMITVIGEYPNKFITELVIMHEVGHNWFYGILASNERDNPWMDEGMNTYYESRYVREYFPHMNFTGGTVPDEIANLGDLADISWDYLSDFSYLWVARENEDQSSNLHSEEFTSYNYGAMIYSKTGRSFRYLEQYLGTEEFDRIMKSYYENWKFKHPGPEDFQAHVIEEHGDSLTWFFDELLGSTGKVDLRMKKFYMDGDQPTIEMVNKGDFAIPYPMTVWEADTSYTIWTEGFEEKQSLIMKPGITKAHVDADYISQDLFRFDNFSALKGSGEKMKVKRKFQMLGTIENPKRKHIYWMPIVGWNNYAKTMVGVAFYNSIAPRVPFEYRVMPLFSTGVIDITGMAQLAYNWYPKKLQRVRIELNTMRFNYNHWYDDEAGNTKFLAFNKITPKIELTFKKKDPTSSFEHKLSYRSINILQDFKATNSNTNQEEEVLQYYHTNEIKYALRDSRVRMPYSFSATWQHCTDFIAIQTTSRIKINYPNPRKGLDLRFFGGVFLKDASPVNNPTYGPVPPNRRFTAAMSPTNVNVAERFPSDHTFDQIYLDRSGYGSFSRRQTAIVDGGFRSLIPATTDEWIVTMNLASSFVWKLPIRPFASIGVGEVFVDGEIAAFAELGASIAIIPEVLAVHFPFVTTNNIKENQELYGINKYGHRITFTLDLTRLNPFDIINSMKN